MLALEVMGVTHSAGTKKDGGKFDFSRILVSIGDAWFEVVVNGETDLQKGDTAIFDLVVRMGNLRLVYTGQKA